MRNVTRIKIEWDAYIVRGSPWWERGEWGVSRFGASAAAFQEINRVSSVRARFRIKKKGR